MKNKGAVIITGAAGGVGMATVMQMAERGYRVYAGVRKQADIETLNSFDNPNIQAVMLNVADEQSIISVLQSVVAEVGEQGVSAIISNAAQCRIEPYEYTKTESIDAMLQTNLRGAMLLVKHALPFLRRSKGRVIFVGSATGLLSSPAVSVYAATKWGLEGFCDAIRQELASFDVAVSMIEPGVIKTKMLTENKNNAEAVLSDMSEDDKAVYGKVVSAVLRSSDIKTKGVPAEKVADVIMTALQSKKPKARYQAGADARAASVLRHLPDGIKDWLTIKALGIK